MAGSTHHQVLIVGGGSAGITVAAILKRRAPVTDIAIIEPSPDHYYQPALTLVGAGVYPLARTRRAEESLIPVGVRWIHDAAKSFEPEQNTVRLKNGDALTYDYLVVCTGVKLDWGKIAGLAETLGKNGVCSNYSPAHATYTWDCLQKLKAGGRAVFTQPPLPFKCPGAPQKIVYLTADHLQRQGILKDCSLDYYVHAPVIFGVPFFARELVKIAARYGINVHYQQNLVAVDGAGKTATFEKVGTQNKGERVTVPFDMLHVSPPQSSPEERSLIEHHIPFATLEDAPIPVHVVATDFGGASVCLSSGPAVEAILASAAIPAAFPSVRVGGHDLIDGAVGGNTPILTAADLGATRIIALPTGFACAMHERPMGAIARALHAITLLIAHQMVRDLRECVGKVDVFTVPNLCPLDASPYDFSHADQLIEQAAERTRKWIEGGGLSRTEIPDTLLPHSH